MGGVASAFGCGKTKPKVDVDASFYDLSAVDWEGKNIEFKQFEGQVCLVVNVASK